MSSPTISVIMPAFNAEAFLAEAIDSVLAQTYRISEIIVYNDGSTDGTQAIIDSYGDRLVNPPTLPGPARGVAFGRNQGLRAATGDLLAFLDADDLWLPQKIELQVAAWQAHPQPCAIFGQMQEFDAQGSRGDYQKCALLIVGLIPRTLALQAGTFDESLALGDYADWLVRLQALGLSMVYLDKPLARRRLHENNLGSRQKNRRKDYLEVVRRKLQREREQALPPH